MRKIQPWFTSIILIQKPIQGESDFEEIETRWEIDTPYVLPNANVGVWQAPATRGGGDCISADAH